MGAGGLGQVGEAEGGEPIGSAAGGGRLSDAGTVELGNRTDGRFGGRTDPDTLPKGRKIMPPPSERPWRWPDRQALASGAAGGSAGDPAAGSAAGSAGGALAGS